jgi:hypothetical protein
MLSAASVGTPLNVTPSALHKIISSDRPCRRVDVGGEIERWPNIGVRFAEISQAIQEVAVAKR